MQYLIPEEKTPTIKEIQKLRESIGWHPRSKKAWEKIIKKSIFFSIYDKKILVGVGRMVEEGTMCTLFDHCIRKEYQRKGLGTKIILARVAKAKELGCTYIQGFASEQSFPLFEKLGFSSANGV